MHICKQSQAIQNVERIHQFRPVATIREVAFLIVVENVHNAFFPPVVAELITQFTGDIGSQTSQ